MTVILAALAVAAGGARGQTPWYEGFEGTQPSWRPAGGDAPFQVISHCRVRDLAFTGQSCEQIAISVATGTCVYFSHDVGRPRVIDELLPTVQIRSDRPGVQFLARVVLPRTRDPRTGQPVTAVIPGSILKAAGRWEQLRIENLVQQLERRTRVLRAEMGPQVDPREAYVESVLLNVYGGPGVTNVWIDDLDVAGHVEAPRPAQAGAPDAAIAASTVGGASGAVLRPPPGQRPQTAAASLDMAGWRAGSIEPVDSRPPEQPIRLDGSVLLVHGHPFCPRILQYRGEPLAVVQRLGFNAVWLEEPPSQELLDEATRTGLWLIAPPPAPIPPGASAGAVPSVPPIGPEYERVLAWDLGRNLSARDLDAVKLWADRVRAADRTVGRPLICRPQGDLRRYSQHVDILVIGRSPLGTELELSDYGEWLRQRPRLTRPGSPVWTTIDTQLAPSLVEQWAALGIPEAVHASASSEQIRLVVYTAVTAGVRGMLFESRTPLDAPDAATQNRAATLELLNLELSLIEPWLAAGDLAADVAGSDPEVVGGVLRTDRARLLVPIWSGLGSQLVPGQSAGRGVSFVVPGVPEASQAYLLSPGQLEPLRYKRVTGGTRVTLDEFGLTSLVVFTGEPLVLGRLRQRSDQIGRRAALLQRDLAAAKLAAVAETERQLSPQPAGQRQSALWLRAADDSLRSSDAALAAGRYADAYRDAQRAMRPLRLIERGSWETAVRTLPSAVSHPAALSFATLPWFWRLRQQVVAAPQGPNLLPGGTFEDLDAMLASGWLYFPEAPPGIEANAELSSAAARSGRYGVRLAAWPQEGEAASLLVEAPPASLTSPGVLVEAGQVVAIHGWVQVAAPIEGSVDGLVISDSLGGEPLAQRIQKTDGWQEFTLYRIAPQRGMVAVTFALSGLGEAWIDDVTIAVADLGSTAEASR